MSKIYPIGIQNFESLRKDGYFYVDKTALIYQLVKTGRYYFLSRPRRFGKSLLLSTLQAYYEGKKELFAGLAMEELGFLTGVTKFGKVSVFSDLNNLIDLSMWDSYVPLCGITEEELHRDFDADIRDLAQAQGMTFEIASSELKARYDGYHFTENSPGIYNPFSVLNTLAKRKFGSYWFETGTPSYLVELLQRHNYDLHRMAHEETNADVLNSIDSESTNPIPVIYQSGYLTIKGYDPEFGNYRLGFPNREVEEGFIRYLLPFYANTDKVESPFEIQQGDTQH